MPYYPEDNQEEVRQHYNIGSQGLKTVADYAHIPLTDVLMLNVLDFLALRRDAYISALSKTEQGREYLENAWMREQTEPDRCGLREIVYRD